MQLLLLYATPILVLLLAAPVYSEECESAFKCESLVTEVPSCKNMSQALQCFTNSCESNNPAIMLNIQAYQIAELVLCDREDLREGFDGKFSCWMIAISCSWMHLVAESAEATRQTCIYRRKSMRQCITVVEDQTLCQEIIGNFTDALNAISACGASQLTVTSLIVTLTTAILLFLYRS